MKHHDINDVLKNFDKKLNKNYKILKEEDIQNMQDEYEEKLKEKNKIKNKLINKKNKLNKNEPTDSDSNQSEQDDQFANQANEENDIDKIENESEEITSFSQLNICEEVLQSIQELGWEKPTLIQQKVLPLVFQKRDIIGLSETGSGKTACFIIPILQELKYKKQSFFALIISPTRELCIQIAQNAQALGSNLLINICTIFGGVDIVTQSLNLAKKPNIIISTPGRILDHLNNTKGFNLKNLKYLVFDEADKLLSLDFESSINKLLLILPSNRITFLFSATMTKSVAKLKKASLKNPIKIEVSNKYSTVKTLIETYIFLPLKYKYTYLCSLCFYFTNKNIIIFANTCATAQKLNFFCRNLGLKSICLHGKLTQNQRLSSLNLFKTNKYNILISTQVGARGLDLQNIKIVINFDLCSCKEYIHRVGRTARAGKTGKSITFVTQYDVEAFLTIEKQLNKKIDKFTDIDEHDVLVYHTQALEALRLSEIEMKENQELYKKNKFKKKK